MIFRSSKQTRVRPTQRLIHSGCCGVARSAPTYQRSGSSPHGSGSPGYTEVFRAVNDTIRLHIKYEATRPLKPGQLIRYMDQCLSKAMLLLVTP